MRASKFNYLTETELRVLAAALEHYIKLGPETSGPIKIARKLQLEIHDFVLYLCNLKA